MRTKPTQNNTSSPQAHTIQKLILDLVLGVFLHILISLHTDGHINPQTRLNLWQNIQKFVYCAPNSRIQTTLNTGWFLSYVLFCYFGVKKCRIKFNDVSWFFHGKWIFMRQETFFFLTTIGLDFLRRYSKKRT